MVEIRRLSRIGKASPSEDFRVLQPLNPPPEAAVKSALGWLQAHLDAGNDQSVTVARVEGQLWLFRAENEAGTDNAGRPMADLTFGEIAGTLSPHELTRLLFGAYRDRKPSREDRQTSSIPLGPESAPNEELAVKALLCLALGFSRCVVVDNDATAALVLERIRMENISFVSLMRRHLPSRWPEGLGLVVSQAPWEPASMVRFWNVSLRDLQPIDLAGLMRLEADPERRGSLLRTGLSGEDGGGARASSEAVEWLLRTERGRGLALRNADAEQISALLAQGRLMASDLENVEERLRPQDSRAVARLLRATPDGVRRFIQRFGAGAVGIEDVLPPDAAQLWSRAQDPTERWEHPYSPTAARALEEARLLESLPDAQISRLLDSPLRPLVEFRWRDRMLAAGMTSSVFAEFFDQSASPSVPPASKPAPEPRREWVGRVPKDILWNAGRWACAERAWRNWWIACLREHPDFGAAAIPSLDADWSETMGEWALGTARDGVARAEDCLSALARWRAQPSTPSIVWQQKFLRACGLKADDGIMQQLAGKPVVGVPSAEDQRDLSALLAAQVLDRRCIVRSVVAGSPVVWLGAAGIGAASLSLLDEKQAPPAEPPSDWEDSLDPVLAVAACRAAFWQRFDGNLSPGMLAWMVERVSSHSAGARVRSLLDAYQGARRLCADDVKIFAAALPSAVVCRQLIAWSRESGPERDRTLGTLLASPSLRPELCNWLGAELLSLAPVSTAPRLTAEEATSLLPILHAVRDVLRPLFARPDEELGEDTLADALADALTRSNLPCPPPPPAPAAGRHPRVVRRLAALPGWESWRRIVDALAAPSGAGKERG